ncbi:MAG: pyruvate kinase [Gemmiger sp.]|nr:pyruvate kinase [Gemmiger sp.]
MHNTKIVCTLGPATEQGDVLRQLMLNGMNVARFNFSHGDHAEHKGRLDKLKALRTELNLPVATMLDTKGPEIRLGNFKNGAEKLVAGAPFTLTTRNVEGTAEICSITYKELPHDVVPGGQIMLDDGLISLHIDKVTDTDILCTVDNDGTIKDKKGINVIGVHLSMPYLSAQDKSDILFGIEQGYDLISTSFTRCAQDILEIRHLLSQHNANLRIIAKIENQEGVNNIDEILSVTDGIMVARGDMGVEIPFAEIPAIQKRLIDRAMVMGKPVITATQMLDSMIVNPRPTRAEITDVANAIYDGTTAVMLSGETAAGKHPVEALKAMVAIAESAENDSNFDSLVHHASTDDGRLSISAATAHAACTTADDIHANAIITVSKSGETARLLSKCRPETRIIACVLDESTRCQLNAYWGITPLVMDYAHSTDELITKSVETALAAGLIKTGDMVVVTAGVPVGVSGTTNMIKVHLVGNSLLSGVGIGHENACGRVCICRTAAEAAQKMKPGDILVAPYTTNDFLPYMREAAGVIVQEPGTTSHAAIVGLTLGKAVIVGASGAMSILQDGANISMDCEHGVVQLMA